MKNKSKVIKAIIVVILIIAVAGIGIGVYFMAQSNSNPNEYDTIKCNGDTFYVTKNLIDYEVVNVEGTTNQEYTLVMFMPPESDTENWAEVLYSGDTDDMNKNRDIQVAFRLKCGATEFFNPQNQFVMSAKENKLYDSQNNYLGEYTVNTDGTVNCTDKDGKQISYTQMGEYLAESVDPCIKVYWDFYGGLYEN